MAELSSGLPRRAGLLMVAGFGVFAVAVDFVLLQLTYLAFGWIAPAAAGAVADRPVVFATWVALLRLPMVLAYILVAAPRGWRGQLRNGEFPDTPERPKAVRVWVLDGLWSVLAALIVFHYIADPGDAHFWGLVALTAAGPLLLTVVPRGGRWLWRRRRA
ncbi:hypothetical protein M1L60_44930 [Actinoplanes sp. TRM 88003]|uniref:Uncharacterized protein n=1 Tax=Paractinoplanes aksuensis TaxID=2939490 RepID=A0ABT1E3N7_9ACTN|nr:hypothetical protein [Actinoplanes aksuensis]MCO8277742.1 hypothetical protein [Actinoplanes aksuensis]